MGFLQVLLTNFYIFLASLNYALLELIIAEIVGYIIIKTHYFKKSEYFVFMTIGFGLLIFFISGLLQDIIVGLLSRLKGWLLIPLIIMICLNIILLSKIQLNRRWGFRLVIYPIIIILIIILALAIFGLFIVLNQTQQVQVVVNTTGI